MTRSTDPSKPTEPCRSPTCAWTNFWTSRRITNGRGAALDAVRDYRLAAYPTAHPVSSRPHPPRTRRGPQRQHAGNGYFAMDISTSRWTSTPPPPPRPAPDTPPG